MNPKDGNLLYLEALIEADPFNPANHLALAKAYLERGDEGRARKVVAVKRRLPSKEPSVHFEWGKLCEELGMARQAVESYEQAIALDPNRAEYHFRIAQLFYERGASERAVKHLQKTLTLDARNQKARTILATLYEEMGLKGLSERLLPPSTPKPSLPSPPSLSLAKEDVTLLKTLFQGKEIGYAQFQMDEKGNLIPSYHSKPWGEDELRLHLRGEIFLGVYPMRSDRTLKFAAIRIRIPTRRLFANIKNEGFLTLTEDHIHHYAKSILDTSRGYGLPVYLENHGGRGRRLWFFFEEFIPFDLCERFLLEVLDKVPSPGVDLTTELLLGRKGAGIGWVEEPISLPLGINPLTLKRCFFVDREGDPFEDQFLHIRKIRAIEPRQIQLFLKAGRPQKVLVGTETPLKKIEARCPVLSDILKKAHSGRNLTVSEKLTLFFTLGFLEGGRNLLHQILEPCPDYRPRKVDRMLKRVQGKPISCPKIRQLMPERTAYLRCNCSFDLLEGGYPTPLLHLK